MDVTAHIHLNEEDTTELCHILDCDQGDLSNTLSAYASAALKEYVTMFLGQKVFTRGSDIIEYKLFLLIAEAFENRIPDEQEVCRLFQTTATGSRSIIRSVMSKYQYQLKAAIERSMQRLIQSAQQEDENQPYTVTINSLNVVEELNRVLADIDGNLPPVSKKRGSVSTYEIARSSYTRLMARLLPDVQGQ